MSVYFIRSGNFIKIGVTNDVGKRLKAIQTGSPMKLDLLGTMPGGYRLERHIHRMFSRYRVRGEWYEASGELLSFINRGEVPAIKPFAHKRKNWQRQTGSKNDWRVVIETLLSGGRRHQFIIQESERGHRSLLTLLLNRNGGVEHFDARPMKERN